MLLTRLIYVSDLVEGVDFNAEQMLVSARDHNRRNHITGVLWFSGKQFIQVLEGGRHAVSETYHRISKDSRHHNIELVGCNPVDERAFPAWEMGFLGDTEVKRKNIMRFSTCTELRPESMTPSSLLSMLLALSR